MRAIEFKSKIKDNQITLPENIQSELAQVKNRVMRIIVLYDEYENDKDNSFKTMVNEQFLKGYAGSDSIYDNY
jgi:hypothetical protein